LVRRVSGRFTCANCGAVYHDDTNPTTVEGTCDACGATEFKRRTDDNAETMRTRLLAYYKDTSPLIGYYYAHDRLQSINGLGEIEEVASQLDAVLNGTR
ncbi:MAG: adenylate kinase, partial [Pseudomonadota bacterium]